MLARIIIFIVAAVLLAAHFLRAGNLALAAFCLLLPLLFAWRRHWSLVALQVFAYAAAMTWLVAAVELVVERQAMGRPWLLAAGILATVAAYTVLAGILLRAKSLRQRYVD